MSARIWTRFLRPQSDSHDEIEEIKIPPCFLRSKCLKIRSSQSVNGCDSSATVHMPEDVERLHIPFSIHDQSTEFHSFEIVVRYRGTKLASAVDTDFKHLRSGKNPDHAWEDWPQEVMNRRTSAELERLHSVYDQRSSSWNQKLPHYVPCGRAGLARRKLLKLRTPSQRRNVAKGQPPRFECSYSSPI